MPDITTLWDAELARGDWAVALRPLVQLLDETGQPVLDETGQPLYGEDLAAPFTPGLAEGADLETAVLISLFTDRRADPEDRLPDGSQDPRGWWGDQGKDRPIGSKIWLRMRSKRTTETLQIVKGDIQEALQWLLDDGVVATIDVTTQWDGPGFLAAVVTLSQVSGTAQALRYSWAWKDIG